MSTNSHSFFLFLFFCVCVRLFIFWGVFFFPPMGLVLQFNLSQQKVSMDFVCKGGEKTYLTYNQRSATFPYICTDITAETVKHGKIPKLSKLQ